jgi:hypothetical protein
MTLMPEISIRLSNLHALEDKIHSKTVRIAAEELTRGCF